MVDARQTGARVRMMRVAAGLDQTQLADKAGIGVQSLVSRVENGRAPLDDGLLSALATAVDCSPSFLTTEVATVPPVRPWLRAYADAPKRSVDQQVAECSIVAEVIERLGLRTLPDAIPLFDGDLNDDDAIEQFALEVRQAADVPDDAVVRNVTRAAERLGCVVLPMDGELGRHLGMSTVANLRPMICVSRPSSEPTAIPGDRQRFTVAHELGHLALHRSLPAPRSAAEASSIERQAHRFAAAFLAPGDALREELSELGDRVTLRTLAELKGRWGVAIKALVVRFQHLGVIDEAHARSLYKQISARKWNKSEPVHVGNERAIWLDRALGQAAGAAPDPLAVAAREAGLGRSHFERWVTWDPADDRQGQLLEMPAASDPSTREDGAPGTVSVLAAHRRA